MKKVFIDGSAGTTGLRIRERLAARTDLSLIVLSEENRKEKQARRAALNEADIAFLCLPDDAAREAVSMIENDSTAVIDTSTAHRIAPGWVYGFPELSRREAIAASKRIANPGCHASGFVALVAPLVANGLLSPSARLTAFSLTGYSGGGKKMIAEYEGEGRDELLDAPRQYGLSQSHKHLPEMSAICGIEHAPLFSPIVADYYRALSLDRETVELRYRSELNEASFAEILERSRQKDIINEFTTVGIHRDDIVFTIGGMPLRKFGSQGQQKSFLIALKLAQYGIIAKERGERPILLLDDVCDKLDEQRVEQLVRAVSGEEFGQIVITDCNEQRLRSLLDRAECKYTIFNVKEGVVAR